MGILSNALAIILGSFLGGKFKKLSAGNYNTLGIGIMIVSLVGFTENMYNVENGNILGENLLIVLFSFIAGSKLGEIIRLEDRLSGIAKSDNKTFNAVIDASLFFGVGGLQISGPVALALSGDNSQLFIKSFVDVPFAIAFGAAYGPSTALSALPVAAVQIVIAVIAYFFSSFLTAALTAQICAMGYIILFFSGFNLMTDSKHKINNINMLPSIFCVIIINLITELSGRFI